MELRQLLKAAAHVDDRLSQAISARFAKGDMSRGREPIQEAQRPGRILKNASTVCSFQGKPQLRQRRYTHIYKGAIEYVGIGRGIVQAVDHGAVLRGWRAGGPPVIHMLGVAAPKSYHEGGLMVPENVPALCHSPAEVALRQVLVRVRRGLLHPSVQNLV